MACFLSSFPGFPGLRCMCRHAANARSHHVKVSIFAERLPRPGRRWSEVYVPPALSRDIVLSEPDVRGGQDGCASAT